MPPLATGKCALVPSDLGLPSALTTVSMLRRRFTLKIWTWTWLWLLIASLPVCRAASVNVSVSNTSPEIVYTPFVCNSSSLIADPGCKGAWWVVCAGCYAPRTAYALNRNVTNIAGIPTVSTTGPDPEGANIVPQMFLAFRASALYISTSAVSNATANFSVSSASNTVSRVVASAAALVAIVNLVEAELTTLTITFVPGQNISQLDIGSILITVSDPTWKPPHFSLP
ncbi:hypothetical protein B0H17DRAFT_364392 [Mycena rosella]|uniref:Uncharacterized protein n=1 Tax=Mycena rosella TaxID=1033263 RepID=A0AAD7MBB4_MYCRO|nr:hypothetical protein B0H17DRAFT_364392 [Mycena rosella]